MNTQLKKGKRCLGKFYQALPPYFGGKRKLNPWVFGTLAKILPPVDWSSLTFVDAFLGGGAVSLFAKAQGFKTILSNDWSERSQLIGKALLENQRVQLSREDVLKLSLSLPSDRVSGFIESQYCPSVFSARHARALDGALYQIAQVKHPAKRALLLLLVWHLALGFVCFPTSLGSSNRPFAQCLDGLREWDSLNPKRFLDGSLDSLLAPTWKMLEKKRQVINSGVFGGSPVSLFQQDALDFIQEVKGDILYLDPPYAGTLSYEKSNRVLDSILFGSQDSRDKPSSSFSQGVETLDTLLESARHIPVWLLSYGNKAISLEELIRLVQRHVPARMVEGFSRKYQHLPHVAKTTVHQELLIVAYPKTIGG